MLDPEEVKSINQYGLTIKLGKSNRYLKLLLAIEVSTEKKKEGKNRLEDLVWRDSEKLKQIESNKEILTIYYRCAIKARFKPHKEKIINPLKVVLEKFGLSGEITI